MKWIKTAVGSAIILVSLVLIWYVARLPDTQIKKLTIDGVELLEVVDIQETVQGNLQGSYAYILPRTNIFLYPNASIEHAILSTYPEVKEVAVKRDGFSGLHIQVTERELSAYWCKESSCYFMDKDGYIYRKASLSSGYTAYSGALEGDVLRKTFLDGEFARLHAFVRDIENVTMRTAKSVAINENEDVSLTFADSGVLLFARSDVESRTLDNIASVFGSTKLKNGEHFEYADFRFGEKAYVKY